MSNHSQELPTLAAGTMGSTSVVAPFVVFEMSHDGRIDLEDLRHCLKKEVGAPQDTSASREDIGHLLYPDSSVSDRMTELEWYCLGATLWSGMKMASEGTVQVYLGRNTVPVTPIEVAQSAASAFPRVVVQYQKMSKAKGLAWSGFLHINASRFPVSLSAVRSYTSYLKHSTTITATVGVFMAAAAGIAKQVASTAASAVADLWPLFALLGFITLVTWTVVAFQLYRADGSRPHWALTNEWGGR